MLSFTFKASLYSPTGLVDLGTRLMTMVGDTITSHPNGAYIMNMLETARIHEKDLTRDNDLRRIRHIIMANTYNTYDTEVQQAAQSLLKVYTLHGKNIIKMRNAVKARQSGT